LASVALPYLEQQLVKNGDIFASIGAYIYGTVDPGLIGVFGKMEKGQTAEMLRRHWMKWCKLFSSPPSRNETLTKVKNQAEAMKTYESVQLS
jgi:zinc protease